MTFYTAYLRNFWYDFLRILAAFLSRNAHWFRHSTKIKIVYASDALFGYTYRKTHEDRKRED